jgi:hypothetical protein
MGFEGTGARLSDAAGQPGGGAIPELERLNAPRVELRNEAILLFNQNWFNHLGHAHRGTGKEEVF